MVSAGLRGERKKQPPAFERNITLHRREIQGKVQCKAE